MPKPKVLKPQTTVRLPDGRTGTILRKAGNWDDEPGDRNWYVVRIGKSSKCLHVSKLETV